jgi:hypothetical protein
MIPELGVVEGFFGRPWSWRERTEGIRALAPHGYRFYIYAPKADAYLRKQWQALHADAEMERLAEFASHCRSLGVRFGIGLTPFELHLAPGRDWQDALARKLAHLDALRPDDLAILFDDMRGDVPDLAQRQAAIVHFAAERTRASARPDAGSRHRHHVDRTGSGQLRTHRRSLGAHHRGSGPTSVPVGQLPRQ